MKILFSHLKEFFKEDIDISSVSDSLFRLGHENEYYDDIIDIDFTPNKGDCLSIYGLARDLNSIHEIDLSRNIYKDKIEKLDFDFVNEEVEFCPKIAFLKIEIEENLNGYKPYLENYFNDLNISKNNFFTDISNYLAYELGQPTHCYDFNKIKDGMRLTSITESSSFKTLLDRDIELSSGEKVFIKNDEIINFAGIMGGKSTKCETSTRAALIECAFFNPDMIIGKSIKYDIASDAAYKFERGTDINIHDFALRRFISIVNDHVNIKSLAIKFSNSNEFNNKKIEFDYLKINKILGTDFDKDHIENILQNLGFIIGDSIEVPSWRTDIESVNDLAEEVARVIGYDQIKTSTLGISKKIINKDSNSKVNKIRNYLISEGFNEVINDPFVSKSNSGSIEVDNPLDINRSFLRTNLINSLAKNLDYNEKRQKEIIKFFEISDVYFKNKEINSKKILSIIISGRKGLNYIDFNKKLDSAYLKKVISNLGLSDEHIKELSRSSFNSKIKNKIFYIECDVSDIDIRLIDTNHPILEKYSFSKFTAISEFPASHRDVSISLDNAKLLEEVAELIFNINLLNIKELFIFDFYNNKDKNIIKIGFRFIFQSHKKTLKEDDVDKELYKIFTALTKIDGVNIPGLNLN